MNVRQKSPEVDTDSLRLKRALDVSDLLAYDLVFVVAVHANVLAQTIGVLWRGVGGLALAGSWAVGMRPELAGMPITDRATMGAHHA